MASPFRRLRIAAVLAAAFAQPAAAQPVAAPVTAPPAWTVAPDPARGAVRITAAAIGGSAAFAGGCDAQAGAGFGGAFTRYAGGGLRTDGQAERVLFYIRGDQWQEAFSAQLRYVPASQSWQIVGVLAPVFVNSFSRGATFAVLNSRRQEVFAFDLTGSTAAARTMRTVCGLP